MVLTCDDGRVPDAALAPRWSPIRAAASAPGPPKAAAATLVATAVAVLGGLAVLLAPASGTDLAAQHARTLFASQHPGAVVDFRWYGGSLAAAYSVTAPYVEAGLGVRLAGALAGALSAVLLAGVLIRWRVRRPVWAAGLGAAGFVVNLVSGRVAFALGMAVGLAALAAVPPAGWTQRRGSRWRWAAAVLLAALTTLTSPVAALFLALVALAWSLRRRAVGWLAIGTAVPMALLAWLFHETGRMPFTWPVARPILIAAVIVAVVARPLPVRLAALAYAGGASVVYLTTNPIGSNVERLALLFTPAVVAASARGPRLVVAAGVLVAGQWTARDPITDLGNAHQLAVERAAAHRLVGLLSGLTPMTGRVEVVPFLEHGESDVVAQAWPLARGWERQVDTVRAAPLYRHALTADDYHRWLLDDAVQYVAIGRHRHDWSAAAELRILRSHPPYLSVAAQTDEWTVFRVVDAAPLVAGAATLQSADPADVVVTAPTTGVVNVDVRWSRWLTVSAGSCIRNAGGRVQIDVRRPGVVTLSSSYLAPFDGHHC